jgi:hypothetical protein
MRKMLMKSFLGYFGLIFVIYLLGFGYWLKESNSFLAKSDARIEKVHQDLLKAGMPFSQAIEVTTALRISAVENAAFVGKANTTQLLFCVLIIVYVLMIPTWRRAVSLAISSEPKSQPVASLKS